MLSLLMARVHPGLSEKNPGLKKLMSRIRYLRMVLHTSDILPKVAGLTVSQGSMNECMRIPTALLWPVGKDRLCQRCAEIIKVVTNAQSIIG